MSTRHLRSWILLLGAALFAACTTAQKDGPITDERADGGERPDDGDGGADSRPSLPTRDGGSEDARDAGDRSDGPTDCEFGVTVLAVNQKVTFDSRAGNGNAPRVYCFVLPAAAAEVRLMLSGGACPNGHCMGDDVRLFVKQGARPDPFEPDSATTAWSYTPDPGGYGQYRKKAAEGAWYLSIIDDQNTLGYKNVSLSVVWP